MIALDELVKLPAEERLQIIEALERSLENEGPDVQEPPEFIAEITRRSEHLRANPSSGILWEDLEAKIRAERA